jgi:hypothetical protein
MPFGGEWFFFGEYLICLNVAQAILSIFSIVIAEQPKEGCSDRDGEPRPWDSRGSLTGTKVGDTHGSIQDVQIELVGGCFFNSGNISRWDCYWNLLAGSFRQLSCCSHNYRRGLFGVLRIRVVEAIKPSPGGTDLP